MSCSTTAGFHNCPAGILCPPSALPWDNQMANVASLSICFMSAIYCAQNRYSIFWANLPSTFNKCCWKLGCHATVDHLHMPGQAFLVFVCLKLFLQHIQIYSFITYMSSCSTSSGTNCGHWCVVTSSCSWDICLCSFMTYRCDKHSFTVSLLIS